MLLRKSTATLLASAAVLGGAVGGGAVVAVADGGSSSTTTTITAPAATGATASAVATTSGTASAVYRRASPSVVQITAVSTGSSGADSSEVSLLSAIGQHLARAFWKPGSETHSKPGGGGGQG